MRVRRITNFHRKKRKIQTVFDTDTVETLQPTTQDLTYQINSTPLRLP